jgi:hypothetical protein
MARVVFWLFRAGEIEPKVQMLLLPQGVLSPKPKRCGASKEARLSGAPELVHGCECPESGSAFQQRFQCFSDHCSCYPAEPFDNDFCRAVLLQSC